MRAELGLGSGSSSGGSLACTRFVVCNRDCFRGAVVAVLTFVAAEAATPSGLELLVAERQYRFKSLSAVGFM